MTKIILSHLKSTSNRHFFMQTIISNSSEETESLAKHFSTRLQKNDCIALCGELGGGKTTFVRGIYEGLGGDPATLVTSPTFTLLQEYQTPKGILYHFDFYRLNSLNEFLTLDFEEYMSRDGICLVEWGDKIKEMAYAFQYKISFEILNEHQRKIEIKKL